MTPSSTVENYLKVLHDAELGAAPDELIAVGQLAARLGVAPGTATAMAKTLAEAGLVRYQPYLGLRLTSAGHRLAAAVVRRHRLVELFLVRILGMRWNEVHEEADRLEHALSDRVIERMDALLGHPDVDPHGDPIPLPDGTMPPGPTTTLLTCPLRERVTVSRILDQAPEFLEFAERHALVPGTALQVEARDATADRVRLRAGARRIVLGTQAAMKVLVQSAVLVAALAGPAWAQAREPVAGTVPAIAQPAEPLPAAPLAGRLRHSLSGDPVPDATLVLEPGGWRTTSRRDGSFAFAGVPAGRYTLVASAAGFSTARVVVTVAAGPTSPVALALDPVLEFSEAVSVNAETRGAFDIAQPLAVLSGQELGKQLEGSLGAALKTQLGVAERSSGPGASRPVIRGLDGDRVLILHDAHGMGDVSSQSADHGVAVNPATASRIEIVRGPATLLYGSNAIGGLVNVVTNTIPTDQRHGAAAHRGLLTVDAGSAASELGAAAATTWRQGAVAFHVSGAGRRSAEVGTPAGAVRNTDARSATGAVAASWLGSAGYAGVSYGLDDGRYGLPALAGSGVTLTPRRHSVSVRGEWRAWPRLFESARISAVRRAYTHDEIENGAVGTRFANTLSEATLLLAQRPRGRWSGTVGVAGTWRSFSATGAEALTPPVDQRAASAVLVEQVKWSRVTLEGGARVEVTDYRPQEGRRPRDFADVSLSSGLVWRLADPVALAVSVARASRRPAIEELYFDGLHIGNFAYEIGSATLEAERAVGTDASLRWRWARASGELTWFRNAIDGYIFREPTGRLFDGFPVVRFVSRDAVLTGVEAKADVQLTDWLVADLALDGTRGTLRGGDALPRMPPWRGRVGARVHRQAWQAGGEVVVTARQSRVHPGETPTAAAGVTRLFASWSFAQGRVVHTATARLDNATNTLYRNHLSYLKERVAEMGRSLRVVYTAGF